MAQQVKVLVAKSDDLSLIPRTQIVEVENQLIQVVLWPPHLLCSMHLYIYIQ